MPIDISQIQNYFASSSPAALYLMQYFLPLLYLAIAVVVGVGAIRFGIAIFQAGIEILFHKQPKNPKIGFENSNDWEANALLGRWRHNPFK